MEDEEKVDPDFLKGFNEGYTMALYMPELAEKLTAIDDNTPRNSGFKAGRQQLLTEKEVDKNLLPNWLRPFNEREKPKPYPDRTKDRDKGQNRDDV